MNKPLIVKALVDALLAGSANPESAHSRCKQTLGRDFPWLKSLVDELVEKFAANWNIGATQPLYKAIECNSAFIADLENKSIRGVVEYVLQPPQYPAPSPALAGLDIPRFQTVDEIACWLGLTINQLDWFANIRFKNNQQYNARNNHYDYRWEPKRKGGFRLIEAPKSRLKAIQRKILKEMLNRVPPHESVHGFRPKHSPITNAGVHIGQQIVIHMDLKDFFLNIRGAHAVALFQALGHSPSAAAILGALCTNLVPPMVYRSVCGSYAEFEPQIPGWRVSQQYRNLHLPQGAPTSPALANLCAFNLDLRLHYAVLSLNGAYTRYADDLMFSGIDELKRARNRFPIWVSSIASDEGFSINHRKTRVMSQSRQQRVTGIVVNEKLNVCRRSYDNLKAMIYNCCQYGWGSQTSMDKEQLRSHLMGSIAQVKNINLNRGLKLQQLFEAIDWKD